LKDSVLYKKPMPLENRDLTSILTLGEFETLAQSRMSPMAFAYIAGGAGDELTLSANSEDWNRIRLKPKTLVDVSEIDMSTELLDQKLQLPVLLAPAAFHRLCCTEGELATVRGANEAGVPLVLSSFSTCAVEEVAAAARHPVWLQLYFQKDRGVTRHMIQRAESSGCKAVCVTVDTPVLGARYREIRNGFEIPKDFKFPNVEVGQVSHAAPYGSIYKEHLNPRLSWKDIEWLCSITKLPIVLKGILDPEDASTAPGVGVSGLIVSNHGARNLDTVPSTAEALPRITERMNGRLPILVDGGIRRGTDVLKAIALGARAVLIGRPYMYGLAIGGAAGVARVIEILRAELMMAMALTGCITIRQIDRHILWDGRGIGNLEFRT
jgi:4-hydroxymandelate oxidase